MVAIVKHVPKRVLKFTLPIVGVYSMDMPKSSKILSVQWQGGEDLQIWALCPAKEDVDTEIRIFEIFGTGHTILDYAFLYYIDTVQMHGGALVWHVFERI